MKNPLFYSNLILCSAIIALLQGCATRPPAKNFYDLGISTKPAETTLRCQLPPIHVADITAPSALDSSAMVYRLLYDNEQVTRSYANSQWTMTPAQLLTQRVKVQFANNGATLIDYGMSQATDKRSNVQLRLALDDFSQYFVDSKQSYSHLRLRVSAIEGSKLLAQTTLSQQASAETADAPGGAKAMRVAADDLMTNLNNWLCKQLPR